MTAILIALAVIGYLIMGVYITTTTIRNTKPKATDDDTDIAIAALIVILLWPISIIWAVIAHAWKSWTQYIRRIKGANKK